MVLLAVLPTLAAAMFTGGLASAVANRTWQARMADTAATLASAIDQDLNGIQRSLAFAISSGEIGSVSGLEELHQRLSLVAEMQASHVTLLDHRGFVLIDPAIVTPSHDSIQWHMPEIATVASTGQMALGDLAVSPRTRRLRTIMLVPMHRANTTIAMVATGISSERLTAVLRATPRPLEGVAVLVDRHDHVVAASRDVAGLVGQPLKDIVSNQANSAFPQTHFLSDASTVAQASLTRATGWRILYFPDASTRSVLTDDALWFSIIVDVVAAALSLTLAKILADRLTHPLRALTFQARDVATGNSRVVQPKIVGMVAEFEALRLGMNRADAVLHRRGAAERMALREARTGHELLISVVNGTAESIYVKDLELRYVLVNRAALRSGPVPRAEWQVLGRGTADLFPPVVARRIEAADRDVLATGRITSFEQDYLTATTDGAGPRTKWISMTIAPWQDAEGRVVGVVSVSRDITQQRVADTRMRAIQADLLRATRLSSMGAMASGLAHELNQPLAAATNYLNAGNRLLERSEMGDTVALHTARGAVMDAAQQLLRAGAIVRQLRNFVERGEAELQSHDIGEVLHEACELARADGVTHGIALHVEIAKNAGTVLVDRTQIQQVLLNLIRNAAEAINQPAVLGFQAGHGKIVVAAGRMENGEMLISVSDNGPGLADGIAERLFEPFVSTKLTGMGIGLAICRTIIEGHGGRLTASRNALAGMLFEISLSPMTSSGDGV